MLTGPRKECRLVACCLLVSIVFSNQMLASEGANILFFIGFGSSSHRIAMQPLADTLAKGHNVTILVQERPKESDSKVQYFVPEKLAQHFKQHRTATDFYGLRASGKLPLMGLFIQSFGKSVCEQLYSDASVKEWLQSTKFDLVIVDGLFNECGYAISHLHGAKIVVFSVSTFLPWVTDSIGLPDETSSIPDVMFSHAPTSDMSFLQRVSNALVPIFWRLVRQWTYFPGLTKATRDGLNMPDFPSFADLDKNISLFLVNTHVTQEYPRSIPSNVIPVGGISWVEKKRPIPNQMEDFINGGKEGFIYISFGSFIDFNNFPQETQQTFIRALHHFPNLRFIWKLNIVPENLPDNVLIEKWLPQQDLLRHPKIKAFISHSGIGGVNEAIYGSVPMICFPVLTEQDYNAALVQSKGFGIKMEITALTESDMKDAIEKLVTNESYRLNAKKMTQRFLDRPMKPLDTAVWWVEYVLRHEDTDFLRPHSVNQPWWVKRQLDVWVFILLVLGTIQITTAYIFYKVLKKCLKRNKSNEQGKKLKKS